ncbi:MAG TPA: PIN domain-containing protein [Methylomirabilota bacterium]|nr:PIN domain-containing protein [Methylomirabilota bacterium]
MAGRTGKTESVSVCLDASVLIAGLLSRTGASHAILILGEIGLLSLVLPEAVVEEVRRNLSAKLPEAVPLFDEFLRSVPVRIYEPTAQDRERARNLADAKDVAVLAAAIGAGTPLLVTHNVRHSRSGKGCASDGHACSWRRQGPGWPTSGDDIRAAGQAHGGFAQ